MSYERFQEIYNILDRCAVIHSVSQYYRAKGEKDGSLIFILDYFSSSIAKQLLDLHQSFNIYSNDERPFSIELWLGVLADDND